MSRDRSARSRDLWHRVEHPEEFQVGDRIALYDGRMRRRSFRVTRIGEYGVFGVFEDGERPGMKPS